MIVGESREMLVHYLMDSLYQCLSSFSAIVEADEALVMFGMG